MGLYAFEVASIAEVCKDLTKPFSVMSLGHPDILATPVELEPIVGTRLPVNEVRGSKHQGIVGAAKPVFEALGGKLTVVDVREMFGVDRVRDFNYKPAPNVIDKFDLVIDAGSTEHCFNVGTALINIADSVRAGGYVWHMVPLADWNQGFWNFSPHVFSHLYAEENGFTLLSLLANRRGKWIDVEPDKKFRIENDGRKLYLNCIARKDREVEIEYPIQRKYR